MNNSEGQTQEPVGGMKWEDVQILAKKHAEQIIEMGWRDSPDKDDIIADFISGYASAPPPSPVGIDVDPEELWDEFSEMIDSDISDLEYFAGRCVITHDSFNKLINKIKAGYSASLPQSSTEEEKIKPIRELTEDDCGTWFLFYNSHAGWWEKEICNGMDRIYSGWTHFTQLPDTPTNL